MPDLSIELVYEAGQQVYYSGTAVTGNVLLTVDEPKSYKRIVVHLTGRSHVHWKERHRDGPGHSGHRDGPGHSGHSGHRDGPGHSGHRGHKSGSDHHTVSYTSSETYVDLEAAVWDGQQTHDGKLGAGRYSWPFRFSLPALIPSSFEGSVGHIRYTLVGKIVTGLFKFDQNVEAPVPIQQLAKISDPRLLQPARQEVQKTVCCLCCASGPISLTVALPKTGFLIGESFQLQASLENGSSRQVKITASITQSVMYYAQGHHSRSGKTVVSIESDEIDAQATKDWNPTIQIPTTGVDIVHEGSSSNIKVAYTLIVACDIPGAIDLSTSFPLQLGNCSDQQQNTAVAAYPPVLQQPGPPQLPYPPAGAAYPYPEPQVAPLANEKTPLLKK